MLSKLFEGEYVDASSIYAKILHLNNQLQASDPLIALFLTWTSNYLLRIVLNLDFEAVLETRVSLVLFEISIVYRKISNLGQRDLIEGIFRDTYNTNFLHEESLHFHV